ncbi:MAG: response regulator [Candidatus Omnitrophota bacterium]|nr:MAG: response regulator [Candidatus Omnitrophota bacterium]
MYTCKLRINDQHHEREAMMNSGNELYENRPVVLIADDDDNFRLLARKALEVAGFRVEEVEDGERLLELFEQIPPDIVLLDIMMPGMDGFMVCSKIRERPGGEYIPVLMVTGLDDIESISKAYEVGATDFITKPINWLILSHRVRFMMRTKKLIDEIVQNELQALADLYVIPDLLEDKKEIQSNHPYSEWLKNLRALERIAGEEILTKVIRSFLEETPILIQAIQDCIDSQDIFTMQIKAILLKSNSSNLGITKMIALCKELEEIRSSEFLSTAREKMQEIEEEFNRIKTCLIQEFL